MLTNVIEQALSRSPQYKRFLEEEAAAEAARIKHIADQASAPLRQANAAMTKLMVPTWSKPVPQLKAMFQKAQGNKAILTTWFWNVLLRSDTTPIPQDQKEQAKIFDHFCESTLPSQGWRLSISGCTRLWAFVYVQIEAGGNNVTPENLQLWFDALKDNECFDSTTGELSYSEPVRAAPEPPRVPTNADFETLNLSSDEGRLRGIKIAEHLFAVEARPYVQQWAESLLKRFQFDISQDQLNAVRAWMEKWNKSPRSIEALEQCRRALVRSGIFPEHCLDHDDLKSIAIDALPSDDYASLRVVFHGSKEALKELMQRKGITVF